MDVAIKSGALIGSALALWLVPMSVPVPRFLRLLTYTGAMSTAIAAVRTTEQWAESDIYRRQKKMLDTDLLNTSLALEQASQEEELRQLYFPPTPSPLPLDAAAPSAPSTASPAPTETKSTSPDYLDELIALSKEVGWLDASIVKQKRKTFRAFTPDQIRAWFSELEKQGIGKTSGDGTSLKWNLAGSAT